MVRPYLLLFTLLALFLSGCQEPEAAPTPAVPTRVAAATPVSAAPAQAASTQPPALPGPSPTAAGSPTTAPTTAVPPTATLPPTATAPPSLTPTPDPYADLTLDALAARSYGGGQLEIVETLEQNDRFARYLIRYPSDGLTIYGFISVPNEGYRFPVALVLHGYIPPAEYETVAYTSRYADALAEAGYFVIHPNFRGYPPSDDGPDPFRTGFAVDVLNLIAILREQSQDPLGPVRRANADEIHLFGHSMGGGVALRVLAVDDAPYLKAAVLYGSMSGDERKNYEQIKTWTNGSRGDFELSAPPEMMAAISPLDNLDRIKAPISIHHSDADDVVPVDWSIELCDRLEQIQHPVECFIYTGAPHTFYGQWDEALIDRTIAFFDRY